MVSTVVQMRLCAILAPPPPFLLYRNGIEFFAMILYANTKELDADYLHFTLFFSAGIPTPSMNTWKILKSIPRASQKLSVNLKPKIAFIELFLSENALEKMVSVSRRVASQTTKGPLASLIEKHALKSPRKPLVLCLFFKTHCKGCLLQYPCMSKHTYLGCF